MSEEKKIYVDEDWKSRVQAEKEQARQDPKSGPAPQAETPAAEPPPLPPPSLELICAGLQLQALIAMGLIADPLTKQLKVDLAHARHAIDTIALLERKTEGNRMPEETEVIEQMLHELRMAFVEIQ
jgi:hypothetical protein